jgi:hypothetical protein
MGTKVKRTSPGVALDRVLEALGQDLIEASDEEIIQAAKDLGMDPTMRESAAFRGLKYPATPQLSDFFELEVCRKLQAEAGRIATVPPAQPKRKAQRSKRTAIPADRKHLNSK